MATHQPSDWTVIAAQASTEMNPQKLMLLIQQLTRALDERTLIKSQPHARSLAAAS
jgi:hypothetical protein